MPIRLNYSRSLGGTMAKFKNPPVSPQLNWQTFCLFKFAVECVTFEFDERRVSECRNLWYAISWVSEGQFHPRVGAEIN